MRTLDEIVKVELDCESGKYDTEYAEYIMEHSPGDRIICDGDMLIIAMEEGYLYDDFVDFMIEKLLP